MKHEPPDLRKAHDVRHLCVCKGCGELGDDRKLLRLDSYYHIEGYYLHGDCAFRVLGARILDLPTSERNKFTLGEVGVEMMRRLMRSE